MLKLLPLINCLFFKKIETKNDDLLIYCSLAFHCAMIDAAMVNIMTELIKDWHQNAPKFIFATKKTKLQGRKFAIRINRSCC